jgi:hypothetical protein
MSLNSASIADLGKSDMPKEENKSGEQSYDAYPEVRYYRKDGSEFWAAIFISAIFETASAQPIECGRLPGTIATVKYGAVGITGELPFVLQVDARLVTSAIVCNMLNNGNYICSCYRDNCDSRFPARYS